MDAYVKSFATYRTVKHLKALSHSLVLDSLEDEASTVTVLGSSCGQEDTGNWLILEGQVFRIRQVKPQENQTVLTVTSALNAFTRPLELSLQELSGTIGGFVGSALLRNWAVCEDPVYAIGYLSVENGDNTPYAAPETDGSGCFSLADYCRLMRKSYRTRLRFLDGGDALRCIIDNPSPAHRQVSFQDGRSHLKQSDYSVSGIAKITVLCDVDTGEKDAEGDAVVQRERSIWYLSEAGEVSQTVPDRRASGEWTSIQVKNREEVEAKVTETFAKNSFSHKIEFTSSLDLQVQDSCRFLICGQELVSVISSKRSQSGDSRYSYKAGLLATTATEKLRRVTV